MFMRPGSPWVFARCRRGSRLALPGAAATMTGEAFPATVTTHKTDRYLQMIEKCP